MAYELKVNEGPLKIWRSSEGKWCGLYTVQTSGGPVTVAAIAHEDAIRVALQGSLVQAVHRLAHEYSKNPGATAGNIFGDAFKKLKRVGRGIGQTVSNVARLRIKKALQAAARTVQDAVRLPGASLIPGVAQLASATRILARAKQGHPRARAGIRRITQAARAGNPKARQLAMLLQQALRLMMQPGAAAGHLEYTTAGAAIGRWVRGSDGREHFVPETQASGPGLDYMWDQLRPHLGYRRDTADVLTRRKAYRRGLEALATRRL